MPRPIQHPPMHLQGRAGQPLAIDLPAMPGAGMLWRMPDPPAGCTLREEEPATPDAGTAVGAPVAQRFVFDAAAPGRHALRFVLQRPWEAEVRALQTVVVQLR